MNERKLKQLNMLTLIITGVAVLLMFILAFGFKPVNQHKLETGNLEKFNDGWVIRNYQGGNDKLLELPVKLKAGADDILLIMHRIPDDVNKDSVLVFETEFQNIQAYIGDLKVYENGVMNNQKLMKNAVPCINVISLELASPGDVISIYISSGYDRYSGRIGEMYLGTAGDVSSWLIRQNGLPFVFSVVLLVVTLLLGVSLAFMKNVNVDKRKSGFAFGFIFAVALWTLFGNPLMQLVTDNVFGVYMADMILLLLLPILYLMYQRCFAVKRRYAQIFETGIYLFGINLLTGIVFQMLAVCDFATYMIFTKVLITIGMIILTGIMYLAADTFSDRNIYSNFRANVVLTIGILIEPILSLFKFYKPYDGLILDIALYIFMILMVISVEKGVIYEMNQNVKQVIDDMEQEKDMAIKNLNTKLIYKALAQAATNLKVNNMSEGKLIYDTSVYMKCNLNAATDKNMVPFDRELEYIKAYLGIQAKRYPELEISIEDKVTNFMVPYNTIEPIVENSIENGALKSNASGRFVIRSYERLDCFAIQIVDNGPGISPEKDFYGAVDYKTIKKRLKTTCQAGVEIKCKQGKGTIITVKIPKEGFVIKEE
ncbi:MAG: hypothetical protein J5962_04745 [Lachnospiraceae bacterium]|nr:hypothetical protein [Lachnospiraceae bacterium]